MKIMALVVSVMLLFSLNSFAQNESSGNGTSKAPTVTKAGMLSDKEIEELQSEYTDEKTGQKIVFYATFGTAKPKTAFEKKKYEKIDPQI